MGKQPFQTDEEKAIETVKAILANGTYKDNPLLKEFSSLLKHYEKLFKQHRFLIKRGDRQELKMRRMNDELSQTNDLLKGALEKGIMQVREDVMVQVMNLAGELVLTRNQLVGAFREGTYHTQATGSFLHNLDLVTSSLQERIMQTRMQPVGSVFATLPQIITAESQRLKKLIRLEIEGEAVELDKTILNFLSDPLGRLIRNACEHGIETPSERYEAGKPETGIIHICASHDAGQVRIVVQDDGRGIDLQSVKLRALKEGIRTRNELNQMSEREILSLLCMSGVSETLNAVRSVVEQQSGAVEITSDKGKGATIHLKVPLTLTIIPCLIITLGNEKYAVPKASVDELVCLYDEDAYTQIEYAGVQEACRVRNVLIPMVRMEEVLARPEKFTERICSEITEKHCDIAKNELEKNGRIRKRLLFAVVKAGPHRFGLVVDQVIGSEEVVVNPIHPKLKSLDIYSGTTTMGDGTIALILDIRGIAEHANVEFISETETMVKKENGSGIAETQRVLIFESGEQERFAIPLALIRRVQDIETRGIETVGVKEYVTIDDVPVLILRMDRLIDVSPCVKKEDMYLILPKHSSRPFGILMSRFIDVVPVPLSLDEESHIEDGILGTAIVKDRMTLFPDIWRLLEKADPGWNAIHASHVSESSDACDCRILLVEDTSFFRRLLKSYLESGSYTVDTAENGLKAMELMEKADFDLIISDIEMPEMDGWTFLRQVRSSHKHKHIPAIALTAFDSSARRDKGRDVGFNAYETKIDRERLLTCIAQLLKG